MVGLSYVSPLLGVVAGMLYTGVFGTWFTTKMARARGGIMEPEYRLWLFSASVVLVPFALMLWGKFHHVPYLWLLTCTVLIYDEGVGAAQNVHWFGLVSSYLSVYDVHFNVYIRYLPCSLWLPPSPLASRSPWPIASTHTDTWVVRL